MDGIWKLIMEVYCDFVGVVGGEYMDEIVIVVGVCVFLEEV